MRLLLDENLSPRIADTIRELFEEVVHVRDVGLQSTDDAAIWNYAGEHGLVIITKDLDFNYRAFLLGPPPKVVWINRGNCSTRDLANLVRERHQELVAFDGTADAGLLVLA